MSCMMLDFVSDFANGATFFRNCACFCLLMTWPPRIEWLYYFFQLNNVYILYPKDFPKTIEVILVNENILQVSCISVFRKNHEQNKKCAGNITIETQYILLISNNYYCHYAFLSKLSNII